jgi:uncharacterized protein YdaU (DUF1376 family)
MYHYPFHLRDYVTKTRHLTLMEDLAYRRLLDAYYTNEGPLPSTPEACARLVAMRDHVVEVAAVLDEFFTKTDDGWSNERCEEEIAKFRRLSDKGRAGAQMRWAKPEQSPGHATGNAKANATGNAQGNATPMATKNQEPRTSKPPKPPEGDYGFPEFWSAYPRKDAKATALASWMKLKPDDELRGKIVAHVAERAKSKDWTKDGGQFVPMASTFINQRRWEDEVASSDDQFWSNVEPWK